MKCWSLVISHELHLFRAKGGQKIRLEECTLRYVQNWLDMEIELGVLQMKLPSCCEYKKITWTASMLPESDVKGYTLVKWTDSISY